MKESSSRFWSCLGIGLGVLVGALDWSIVQNALPAIQHDIGASISSLQWIMNSFGLFMTALLVTMGRLGDVFGRRRIFNIGLLIFALACLGAALSTTASALIIARAFQGVGFAMLMPTSQALLTHAFPENEHGKAMGVWATLAGVGLVFGPVLGGIIVSLLSWNWIFYINIPIALASFVIVRAVVSESRNEEHPPHLDIKGICIFILALGSLIFAIIEAPMRGWSSPIILGCFGAAVVLFVVYYFVERKTDLPLIQFSFFKNRQFTAGALTIFCGCFMFWTTFFLLPLYLQNFRNETPWVSGLVLLSAGIPFTVISRFSGSAGDRIDKRWLIPGGFLLVVIAALSFALIQPSISLFWVCLLLAIFGAGEGILWSPGTSLGISALPRSQTGVASGAITTIQETGGSIGIAIAGTIFNMAERSHFQALASQHRLNIPPAVSEKVKSLLSAPDKLYAYLSHQAPIVQHKIVTAFKSSFLHGFHAGMMLATAVSLVCLVSIICLLRKKT
ncbi:MFS transporter [Simkania sp.]|uniref:MFS transporter n=1 Tax=Simkania sp. TaxID=34094 RepID=UPI003B52976F